MTHVDLGEALVPEGRCEHCRLDERPIWAHEGRAACASCWTRLLPGVTVTFHGTRVTSVAQRVLPGLAA